MPHQLVPDGFGVIEAAGRYYPTYVHSGSNGDRLYCAALSQESLPYLPAPASSDEQPVSFTRRSEVVTYCQQQEEYDRLSWEWEKQARASDLHPDRTIWYQEEIMRLLSTHAEVLWLSEGRFGVLAHPDGVMVWVSCFLKGISERLNVDAATLDEAWEALYQKVYETLVGEVMHYNAQTRRYEGRCGGRVVQIQPDVFEHALAGMSLEDARNIYQPAYWADVLDVEEDWSDWANWQRWQESGQKEASVSVLSLENRSFSYGN